MEPVEEAVAKLAYLWDGSQPGWGLLRDETSFARGVTSYSIVHPTRGFLILERLEVAQQVMERMLAAGAKVFTRIEELLPGHAATTIPSRAERRKRRAEQRKKRDGER